VPALAPAINREGRSRGEATPVLDLLEQMTTASL
jgi:hypothetical protein